MRGDMVSELRLAALYANQVARAIVRMDDRLSNFFLMPHDLPTIPWDRPVNRDRRIGHPWCKETLPDVFRVWSSTVGPRVDQ